MTRERVHGIARAMIALTMVLAIVLGMAGSLGTSALAADSGIVTPVIALKESKPFINIETNIVLDTSGKPTGYVECVLKVKTPLVQYADESLSGLWTEGSEGTPVTRQNTFRSLSVALQYNTDILVPVSWEHKIEYADDGKTIINAYPDFFPEQAKTWGRPLGANLTSAQIMEKFMDSFFEQKIVANRYGDSNSVVAWVGGPDGLMTVQVNSAYDITFTDETVVAVMRFLYTGDTLIEDLVEKDTASDTGYSVDSDKVTSGHDRKNVAGSTTVDLKDFFWFATDELACKTAIDQILMYTSGRYPGDPSAIISGVNEFYSTKAVYNGGEVVPLPKIAQDIPAGTQNWTDVDDELKPTLGKIHKPKTDGDAVYARGDENGRGSYTSNLLFTSTQNNAYDAGSNVRFGLRAGLTYHGTGVGDGGDKCAVVFYDWNDVVIGAISVNTGDARPEIEAFVEKNFIHPTLRKSTALAELESAEANDGDTAAATKKLKNLATSLDRKYTYAGSHASDYAKLIEEAAGGSYKDAEARMAAKGSTYYGTSIFPDGCTKIVDGAEIDYSGSSYPLTNKLDYAFWRRPVINAYEYDATIAEEAAKKLYTDSYGNATSATEWVTGAIDYDGKQTTDTTNIPANASAEFEAADDDYWYTHGWAVVEDTEKVEDVWTTFSTFGELSDARLPGYDITDGTPGGHVYDNMNYYNMDYIRAAGAKDATSLKDVGGTTSQIITGTETEISFATYDESDYFEFADFSDIKEGTVSMYVKACYEPAEQMSWIGLYMIVTEPHYTRAGTTASTQDGNAYIISFDYERINSSLNGVRRTRKPQTRALFVQDIGKSVSEEMANPDAPVLESYKGDKSYKDGGEIPNEDRITAKFTTGSTYLSYTYALVEEYGASNYIVGAERSIAADEANVLSNFNYWKTGESPDYQNGYDYSERLGTDGFVFRCTFNQILEEATSLFKANQGATINSLETYLSGETLLDLNLRLDAEGHLGDASELGPSEGTKKLTAAQNAIFHALKGAYERKKFDENGIIKLEWHQLQYHILSHKSGDENDGIFATSSPPGVMDPKDCGGYSWCRQDACGENVNVPVNNLKQLLDAVNIIRDSEQPDKKKDTARQSIKDNAAGVLTDNKIYKSNMNGTTEMTVRDNLIKYDFSSNDETELNTLISSLTEMLNRFDSSVTEGETADYGTLTEKDVQKWLMTYAADPDTGNYEFDETTTDKYTYWWFTWETKPEPVDFSKVTGPEDAAKYFVEAVWQEEKNGNGRAWDNLTAGILNGEMRFRSSARGDYFNDTAAPADPQNVIEHDWRTSFVLPGFTSDDLESVKEYLRKLVKVKADTATDWGVNDVAKAIKWEEIQYCLLKGGSIDGYSEYYEVAEGADPHNGQYWWKTKDTRFVAQDPTLKYEGKERKTNATLTELREKLYKYAQNQSANGEDNDATKTVREEFTLWFCEETAVDLVLKINNLYPITAENCLTYADRLLALAVEHYKNDPSNNFESLSWSQIQYYISNNSVYVSTESAQEFTFGDKCPWGENVWREAKSEILHITTLEELIDAIEKDELSKYSKILSDLSDYNKEEKKGLGFMTTSVPDWTPQMTGDAISADNVRNILNSMKTDYEQAGRDWDVDLKSDLDSAWYVIQYYLYNRSFVGTGTGVFADTAAAGKKNYYWKDGWDGIDGYAGTDSCLYNTVTSGIGARWDWIKKYCDKKGLSVDQCTDGLRQPAASDYATWDRVIGAIEKYTVDGELQAKQISRLGPPAWWRQLQFLVIHPAADASDAASMASKEHSAFYWWYSNYPQKVDMPTLSADEYADDVATLNSAAAALMKNEFYALATGSPTAKAIVEPESELGSLAKAMHLRVPPTEDTIKERADLAPYTDATVAAAMKALVEQVYQDGASGTVDWGWVDANGVFTYNQAATNAIGSLSVYQIQHWLATYSSGRPSYDTSGIADVKKEYWWIENSTKPEDKPPALPPTADECMNLMATLLGYARACNAAKDDETKALYGNEIIRIIESEWDRYETGIPSADAKDNLTAANIVAIYNKSNSGFVAANKKMTWAQFVYMAGAGGAAKTYNAAPGSCDTAGYFVMFTETYTASKILSQSKINVPESASLLLMSEEDISENNETEDVSIGFGTDNGQDITGVDQPTEDNIDIATDGASKGDAADATTPSDTGSTPTEGSGQTTDSGGAATDPPEGETTAPPEDETTGTPEDEDAEAQPESETPPTPEKNEEATPPDSGAGDSSEPGDRVEDPTIGDGEQPDDPAAQYDPEPGAEQPAAEPGEETTPETTEAEQQETAEEVAVLLTPLLLVAATR